MYESLFQKTGLNLDRLRRFCEVAEAGSTVQASESNRRPQPSYSRDVLALEEFFGFSLFAREARGGRPGRRLAGLTPQGRSLLSLATDFLRNMEEFQVFSETPATLRIGGGETLMHWVIAAHLDAITAAFPKTTIEIRDCPDAHQARNGLQSGELDFAVVDESAVAGAPFTPQAEPLGSLSYTLFVHKDDLDSLGDRVGHASLSGMPWVSLSDAADAASETVDDLLRSGVTVRLAATVSSFRQVGVVLRGRKLAAFLPTLASGDMRGLGFKRFEHDLLPKVDVPISLLYNEDEVMLRPYLPTAAQTLVGILAPSAETGESTHQPLS